MVKGDRRCLVVWCGFGLLVFVFLGYFINYCFFRKLEFYDFYNLFEWISLKYWDSFRIKLINIFFEIGVLES